MPKPSNSSNVGRLGIHISMTGIEDDLLMGQGRLLVSEADY